MNDTRYLSRIHDAVIETMYAMDCTAEDIDATLFVGWDSYSSYTDYAMALFRCFKKLGYNDELCFEIAMRAMAVYESEQKSS